MSPAPSLTSQETLTLSEADILYILANAKSPDLGLALFGGSTAFVCSNDAP